MEVMHNLGNSSIRKDVDENVGFMLTNKKGGYCSFFNEQDSRYLGLFYFDAKTMSMFKFIENIEIVNSDKVSSLKNGFYFAERKKGNSVESFTMPRNFNSLIYELNSENEINLILDCKNSYDNREWGRNYEIFEEHGMLIVKFTKITDKREDTTDGLAEFILYMVIKNDKNYYNKNGKWVEREYLLDKERNSPPIKRHVYNALRLKGSKFIFSLSKNKNDAIEECNYVYSNLLEIKNKEKESFLEILKNENIGKILTNKKISNEIKIAYVNAINSLNNLSVRNKNNFGIFAGLPWFFQFWSRDVLVSLKAFSNISNHSAKKLIFEYLNKIKNDGRLPNLFGEIDTYSISNADSHGWLFLRCNNIVNQINRNKDIINSIKKSISLMRQNKSSSSSRIREYIKKCVSVVNKKEDEFHKIFYEIEGSLEKSLDGLLKKHTKDGFEVNNAKETWMDTDYEGDDRKGSRIEVQALRLNMYKLLFHLTLNHKYKVLENILKTKVRRTFWDGKILADGFEDFTIRPNIFMAAYAYPELLGNSEWEACFENALKGLWLDWGGLSTIDRSNALFTEESTGEEKKSYHRGDSWFWINNLAAIQLNRVNNKKFNNEIKKIVEASTNEILWKGCIGCHSELSSAKELRSQGCFNQAWSNAMYIELIDEMFQ